MYYYTQKDAECSQRTLNMIRFDYWKNNIDSYIKKIRNNETFDIVKDGNFCEYFFKRYIIGNSRYKRFLTFNKIVRSKFDNDLIIKTQMEKRGSKFDISDYCYTLNPTFIAIKNIFATNATLANNAKNFIKESYGYINDDIEHPNRNFSNEDQTIGLRINLIFKLTNSNYSNVINGYLSRFNHEGELEIRISNYKDRNDELFQTIMITLNINSNNQHKDTIVFYHAPKSCPTFNSNNEKIPFYDFLKYAVDCNMISMKLSEKFTDFMENKFYLYRCNKPLFNENQLNILHTYAWIAERSEFESNSRYHNSDEKTLTRKYFENQLRNELYQKNHVTANDKELEKLFFEKYPMYVPYCFTKYSSEENASKLDSQSVKQVFFATLVQILYSIEKEISNNKLKQDESYITDSFISSRDCLASLCSKRYKDVFNDNANDEMIIGKMIYETFHENNK